MPARHPAEQYAAALYKCAACFRITPAHQIDRDYLCPQCKTEQKAAQLETLKANGARHRAARKLYIFPSPIESGAYICVPHESVSYLKATLNDDRIPPGAVRPNTVGIGPTMRSAYNDYMRSRSAFIARHAKPPAFA